MGRNVVVKSLNALERILGRRHLWRLGRLVYRHARRDGPNDPAINGEYALHSKLAILASPQTAPFRVIDVGANTGDWALHLLETCQAARIDQVRLWAFEPSDEIRTRLAECMQSAPAKYEVMIRSEAIMDRCGYAAFDGSSGITGIKHLRTEEMVARADGPSVQVRVTTLADTFLQEGIEEVDYVKSDVEGFDLSVLRGALSLLEKRRIGVLQFEYNHCWVATRSFLRDVFDLVAGLPYRLCKIVPGGIENFEDWHPELETFFEANYLLIRDDLVDPLGVRQGRFDGANTYAVSEDL